MVGATLLQHALSSSFFRCNLMGRQDLFNQLDGLLGDSLFVEPPLPRVCAPHTGRDRIAEGTDAACSAEDITWDTSSDQESHAESTTTANTSIFSPSPPAKRGRASHKQLHNFQGRMRIGAATLDNISGTLQCLEAMVESDLALIETQLSAFAHDIQSCPAYDTMTVRPWPAAVARPSRRRH